MKNPIVKALKFMGQPVFYIGVPIFFIFLGTLTVRPYLDLDDKQQAIEQDLEERRIADSVGKATLEKLGYAQSGMQLVHLEEITPTTYAVVYSYDEHDFTQSNIGHLVIPTGAVVRVDRNITLGDELWHWSQVQHGVAIHSLNSDKELLMSAVTELEPRESTLELTPKEAALMVSYEYKKEWLNQIGWGLVSIAGVVFLASLLALIIDGLFIVPYEEKLVQTNAQGGS